MHKFEMEQCLCGICSLKHLTFVSTRMLLNKFIINCITTMSVWSVSRLGGIPARNTYGEELLLYLGIIDILQSFRLKKRLEHTMKAMVIDGVSGVDVIVWVTR